LLSKKRRYQTLRDEVANIARKWGLVSKITGDMHPEDIPIHLQYNLEWYTDENLQIREELSGSLRLHEEIDGWWEFVPKMYQNGIQIVGKETYVAFSSMLIQFLVSMMPDVEIRRIAEVCYNMIQNIFIGLSE
jgi:hypothetical protein